MKSLQRIYALFSFFILNFQGGFAASCSTRRNHRVIFLGSRQFSPIIYSPARRAPSRLSRREVIAFAGQQSWDIGRFVRTLYFFNGPPNPLKVYSLYWDFFSPLLVTVISHLALCSCFVCSICRL